MLLQIKLLLKLFIIELVAKGTISAEEAKEFAENEFEKFRIEQDKKYISDFDKIIDECKSNK